MLLEGINLPIANISVKLFAHADDTTVILNDDEQIRILIEIYNEYSKYSGSKLNLNKCSILPICHDRQNELNKTGFKVVEQTKICGIYFGNEEKRLNEEARVNKVEGKISQYANRQHPIFSRATIVNTVILAQIWFVLAVVDISRSCINDITRRVFKFLWRTSEWLKRKECYNSLQDGGLGIIDIKTRIMSYRIREMLDYLEYQDRPDSVIGQYWLAIPLRDF